MKVFETIISILEEKGPLSIPLICHEINQQLTTERSKPILPDQIKTIVTRKKDIFLEKEGSISIHPDKYPFKMVVIVDGDNGITYQVTIDFSKKVFVYFEWRNKSAQSPANTHLPQKIGNLDHFKHEILSLKIWDWQPVYGTIKGITLGKTNWTVKLVTRTKTYVREGTDCYPENWNKFCQAISRLTGAAFQ